MEALNYLSNKTMILLYEIIQIFVQSYFNVSAIFIVIGVNAGSVSATLIDIYFGGLLVTADGFVKEPASGILVTV